MHGGVRGICGGAMEGVVEAGRIGWERWLGT